MSAHFSNRQLAFDLLSPAEPVIHVRHSQRARRMQIRVSPWHGVEVVVPPRHSEKRVQRFVADNRVWIQDAWREIQAIYPEAGQTRLPTSVHLAALGKDWKLIYRQGKASEIKELSPGLLCVTITGTDSAAAADRLREWLGAIARQAFTPWLAAVAKRTGLIYKRIQIRGQRSRWGSCSARGTIALNYKLLFVKPEVVEYLFIHELCHTRHLNHSRRFWSLVGQFEPRFRRLDWILGDSWRAVPAWVETRLPLSPGTDPETAVCRA